MTPVERIGDLLMKRDDKYQPFGPGTVNGGKLRQCMYLVESIKDKYDGLVSCCSIHSPQAPITAAVAHHFGLKCYRLYGGTTNEKLATNPMARICRRYGAQVIIAAQTGRHNVLYAKARKLAKERNCFVVEYGFNISEQPDLLFGAVSSEVENLPDIENLVVTCGSGITTIGILKGISEFKKNIRHIWLVCTAPSRKELIEKNTKGLEGLPEIHYIDLFHRPGFLYEKRVKAVYGGVTFHPNYEAKTLSWLVNESSLPLDRTLLWVVGTEPRR